jgi:hypothetical protein
VRKKCRDAKRPRLCRLRKKIDPGETLDELLQELQEEVEDPAGGLSDLFGDLP